MVIVLVHIYASPLYFTAGYYLIQHTPTQWKVQEIKVNAN